MNEDSTASYQYRTGQPVEQLYERMLQSQELSQFLTNGLQWICASLNRPSSAICIINPSSNLELDWYNFQAPEMWVSQFQDGNSRMALSARQVYASQQMLNEEPDLKIAAIFPVSLNMNRLGSLVIGGNSLNLTEMETIHQLLPDFSRSLYMKLHSHSQQREKKEADLIGIMIKSFNGITADSNQTILDILTGIRTYFDADSLLLLQKDFKTPELIFKKKINRSDEWEYQVSQHVQATFFKELTQGQNLEQIQTLEDLKANPLFAELDETNGQIIYSPIIGANRNYLGALLLINPDNPMEKQEKEIFFQFTSLFAAHLENLANLQKMRINLAMLETKQMEVINSRNILRQIFDNIPISIYIIDNAYTIMAVNKARSNRIKSDPRQLVRKTCYEVLYGRSSPCPACRVNETVSRGISTTRPWQEWISDETHLEWEISTHPVFDEMQVPISAIIQEADITEKRNLEASLIQSEKLAAVGQLAAGVAHEINNPLAAIIANAQILIQENTEDDPDKIESLKLIETAGIRASNVVRNLLSISRKDSQDFEPTDVNRSIRNALMMIQHEIIKHPVTVNPEFGEGLPQILAQQDQLQGVWINLFVNAIDAITATGRQDGLLTIKTCSTGSEIHVIVTDNGKGIEQEKVNKIFEPFYTTKSVGHGTGLGLSVCLRTITEHQGKISVESQPGQGTRFMVTLPVNTDDVPD